MIAEKDPYIQSAYDQLQIISQDKQKRMEYEAREKAIRDHNQFLFEAEQRGLKIGEQRGLKIGEQRDLKIGEQRKTFNIAEKMIEMGYDSAEITAVTGISKECLETLQAKKNPET